MPGKRWLAAMYKYKRTLNARQTVEAWIQRDRSKRDLHYGHKIPSRTGRVFPTISVEIGQL